MPDRLPDRDARAQINGHPQHYKEQEPDPVAFITPSQAPQIPPRAAPRLTSPLRSPSPFLCPPPGIPGGVSQQSHTVFTLWSLQAFFSSPLSNLGKKVYLKASSRLSLIYLGINKGHIFPTVPRAERDYCLRKASHT